MLHSTLPRAFLSPGINYLSYYGEEVLHQCPSSNWHIPIEDSPSGYSRITERHNLQTWQPSRSSTPCPLDLSLKSSASVCVTKTEEPGELIPKEVKDSNPQDEAPRQLDNRTYRIPENDHGSVTTNELEELPRDPRNCPVHNFQSYDHALSRKDSIHLPEEIINVASYTAKEITGKYHVQSQSQTFLVESSSPLEPTTQGYHRQLFLTPQHHLHDVHDVHDVHAPMTPPSTPSPPHCPRRRAREEDAIGQSSSANRAGATTPKTLQTEKSLQKPRKKHARRLKFDEDTSSPVSGTVILGPDEAVVTGDIDPAFNIVEVTEEARAELAKIENRLGPYQCKLCRQLHEDAFQLAQHRCSRIAHVEYRCPECDKRFSCPANLASHRRWHKPKLANGENSTSGTSTEIPCTRCEAKFTRQAALRKHLANQHSEDNNNDVLSFESQENISKVDGNQLISNGSPTNEMT